MTRLDIFLGFVFIASYLSLEIDQIQKGLYNKPAETIQKINAYCADKTKNFCSPLSLFYMRRVLELERSNKEIEEREMDKMRLEIIKLKQKQTQMENFFKKHPKFRIFMDFMPVRLLQM